MNNSYMLDYSLSEQAENYNIKNWQILSACKWENRFLKCEMSHSGKVKFELQVFTLELMAGVSQPQKLWCTGRVKQRLWELLSILLRTSLQDLIRQITCYAWYSVLNTFKLVCPQGKWKAKSEGITLYTNNFYL